MTRGITFDGCPTEPAKRACVFRDSRARRACPRCGLRLERGESDYFLGGMMFNIALAEGVFVILLITTLVATWPRVPWTLLQYGTRGR